MKLATTYYTPEQLSEYYDQLISAGYMTKEQAKEALDQVAFCTFRRFYSFLGNIPNERGWLCPGHICQEPERRVKKRKIKTATTATKDTPTLVYNVVCFRELGLK